MLILAFDTTGDHGGAALYRDSECLASAESETPANYSVTLFQMVARLLREAGMQDTGSLEGLRAVELYAVANGPGSFTGIRVGLAAAQAWAKAFGRPATAVSILEAMVEEAAPQADLALPILDARRGEFFLAAFRRIATETGSQFAAASGGTVLKPEALRRLLDDYLRSGAVVTCLVREHDQRTQALREALPGSLGWVEVRGTLLPAIARLALEAHRKGRVQSPAELDAYYIRRSDAELNWRG
jgi:tRNA threonylcarbamoyladenosine biosynthesis protein TsaB